MGFSQWGSEYIVFAKDQHNGYWLWDGNNLFGAGTVGPDVTVDNAGKHYTSQPGFFFQTTGAGSGLDLSFQIENGSVTKVTVTDPGSGFAVNDLAVVALFGGGTDTQAIANAISPTVNRGGLDEVWVVNGGAGYTGYAETLISGGGGSGASISLAIQNGTITGAAIVTPGTGYSSVPTLTIFDPGIPGSGGSAIPGGSGGQLLCSIAFGQILAINIDNGGSGYVTPPTVIIDGDGTGAVGNAIIQGGTVTSIIMQSYGSGYTKALARLEGGNNAANIVLTLMPFGISGTSVEVYEGHAWIGNGSAASTFPPKSRVIFSDPDSPVGFGNGGGAFESNDSFLRVGYYSLKQSNGFLYLIGDSSMNYISGVQTSTPSSTSVSPIPITTFGNLNVDPQIGSPWPGSVQVLSRNIVFANTVGIYVSYGGAIKKASDQLDGFYATGPIFGQSANFTSAVATIFGIDVYMLLLPVIDPFTGNQATKLLIWDGKKWFTSEQDRPLRFITSRELESVKTAWGSDGTNIFPLFDQPTTEFSKVIQSKLFANPGYFSTKVSRSLSGIINTYAADEDLIVTIDSEAGLGTGNASISVPPGGSGVWTDNAGAVGVWRDNADVVGTWGGTALVVFGPIPTAQQGRLIGLTCSTNASDVALLSLMLSDQVMVSNV